MYYVAMTFELAIAHKLGDMPPGHKCSNLHGHNLEVTVEIAADALSARGFVIEFATFRELFDTQVAILLDHAHTNQALAHLAPLDVQPTAERLAKWIALTLDAGLHASLYAGRDVHVSRVDVRETRHAVASYVPQEKTT